MIKEDTQILNTGMKICIDPQSCKLSYYFSFQLQYSITLLRRFLLCCPAAKYLSKKLAADKRSKAAVLTGELEAFFNDKDCDGNVSFGEFFEQFRLHEDPGDAAEINKLTEEIQTL